MRSRRRHWTVHIVLEPDRDRLLVRGWRVRELAEQVGARPLWLGAVKSWSLPISYAPDLVAVLEYRGAEVVVDSDPDSDGLPNHTYDNKFVPLSVRADRPGRTTLGAGLHQASEPEADLHQVPDPWEAQASLFGDGAA